MPTPLFLQGVFAAQQATQGTAAATLIPLSRLTKCDYSSVVNYDTPDFLVYQNWVQREAIPTTGMVQWDVAGWLDDTDFARVALCPMYGQPTGAAPFVWKGGTADPTPTTMVKLEGLTTARQSIDTICTEFHIHDTPQDGKLQWDAKMMGVLQDPITAPTYTLPAAPLLLRAGQGYITRNAAAIRVMAANLHCVLQGAGPTYTSPGAAPTAGGIPFALPEEFEHQGSVATFDSLWKYIVHTASSLYDAEHAVSEAWVLNLYKPDASAAALVITMPNVMPGTPKTEQGRGRKRQMTSGPVLYDATLGSGVSFALTTAATYGTS